MGTVVRVVALAVLLDLGVHWVDPRQVCLEDPRNRATVGPRGRPDSTSNCCERDRRGERPDLRVRQRSQEVEEEYYCCKPADYFETMDTADIANTAAPLLLAGAAEDCRCLVGAVGVSESLD